MSNQLQTTGLRGFNNLIANEKTQNHLAEVLGEKKASFVNNITALVSNNTMLQKCDPQTIMYAGIKATALDLPLDPSLGFAYVLPYGKQAQFQIGYKGFLQLAQRSGQFKTINVRNVREGEIQDEDFITGEITFKRAEDREKLPVIGYVAFFELLNGFRKTMFMTRAEVEAHGRKFSKSFNNGPWKTDFDAMAEKTVLKRLITKYAPMSVEMADATKADQAVITENGNEYIDVPFASDEIINATEVEIEKDVIEDVVYPDFDENGELLR